MSDRYDLKIVRGEGFISTITASNSGNGPFDLTDHSISGGIRYKYSGPNIVDFSFSVESPATSGVLNFSLTSNQTSLLPPTECLYYVKAFPSGQTIPVHLLHGYVEIYPF